jgi:hypothetical protein
VQQCTIGLIRFVLGEVCSWQSAIAPIIIEPWSASSTASLRSARAAQQSQLGGGR